MQLDKPRVMAIGAALQHLCLHAKEVLDGVTSEDLQQFERYVKSSEEWAPFQDPTLYRDKGYSAFRVAEKRVLIAQLFLELWELERAV